MSGHVREGSNQVARPRRELVFAINRNQVAVSCRSLYSTVQAFYAKKGPFTKQIATEGFSTVLCQLMSPL